MASLSVSAAAPLPPFTTSPRLSPSIPSAHSRRKSRSPNAASLPVFSFNPGVIEQATAEPSNANTPAASTPALKKSSRPPPLPNFSFNPGADLPLDERPSPSHPVLEEMALNQHRMSRSAKPAPLPAFTFSPSIPTQQSTPSPSRTEFPEGTLGRPAGGHKRAGSEFVGGGGVEGPTLVSTSPSKHEARPSCPPVLPVPRRGHVHRRSQAISITDIDTSELIKAHAIAKTRHGSGLGSGPTTPSQTPDEYVSPASPQSIRAASPRSPPHSPSGREGTVAQRPRVEFADKIDVIPRPLSMISSETDGSCSTVRYSHSLSNSINSVASPARAPSVIGSPVLESALPRRPRSADACTILTLSQPRGRSSTQELDLRQRPLSAYATPLAMPSPTQQSLKKKHFWFSHSPDQTPTSTPKSEKSDPFSCPHVFASIPSTDTSRPKTSPERSVSGKVKKHLPFSGGLFSKKPKSRTSKSKEAQPQMPPVSQPEVSNQMHDIFDADDTIVLRSESPELKRVLPKLETAIVPSPVYDAHEEVTSPILDLDAALSPFGSEERLGQDNSNRSAASRIAKLHSSERRGIMDAFGVHRRTESAPIMQPFNRAAFPTAPQGSNPSLVEDVFDEEEEDQFLAGEKDAESSTQAEENEIQSSEKIPLQAQQMGGLGLSTLVNPKDDVMIIDAEAELGLDNEISSNSTLDARDLLEVDVVKRPMTSPMSFNYPSTQSHYASSTEGRTTTSASMISSPDPEHLHFEIPRLAPFPTQRSSDFYLRPSNEDLPSLTDSISTGAVPRISSSANTRSSIDHRLDQRSASMFVAGTSRSNQSWKRSSLASLNRLIPGSANGSRLKFEAMSDAGEEKSRKKVNRLSKLVNFWRHKDRSEKRPVTSYSPTV